MLRIPLKEVLEGHTCPPASLSDFRKYLHDVEFSEENLEFYMLATEYSRPMSARIRHDNAEQKPCAQCDCQQPTGDSLEQLQPQQCPHVCAKPTVYKSPLEQFMKAYRRNKKRQAELIKKGLKPTRPDRQESEIFMGSSAGDGEASAIDIYMGPPSSRNHSRRGSVNRANKSRPVSTNLTGHSDLSDLQAELDKICSTAVTAEIELIPLQIDAAYAAEGTDGQPASSTPAGSAPKPANPLTYGAISTAAPAKAVAAPTPTPDTPAGAAAALSQPTAAPSSTAAAGSADDDAAGLGLKEPAVLKLEVLSETDQSGKITMQASEGAAETDKFSVHLPEPKSSRPRRRNSITSFTSTSTGSSGGSVGNLSAHSITSLSSIGRIDHLPPEALFETAQALMETFVFPGALREINIDDRTRRALIKRFEDVANRFERANNSESEEDDDENMDMLRDLMVPRDLFDEAAKHVFSVMNSDSYPRFLKMAAENMGFFERALRMCTGAILFFGSLVCAATMIWHPVHSQTSPYLRLFLFLSFTFSLVDFSMCVVMVCPYHWMRGVRIINNGPAEVIKDPKIIAYQTKKAMSYMLWSTVAGVIFAVGITFIPARIGE